MAEKQRGKERDINCVAAGDLKHRRGSFKKIEYHWLSENICISTGNEKLLAETRCII